MANSFRGLNYVVAGALTDQSYVYTDPVTQINTRLLLALTWLAIHDDEVREGSVADAEKLFTEGLYEIQRGYNLSAEGVDSLGADAFICFGGTFNKLLEKLVGVHPDVTIEFISEKTATLKLPSVVKEEAQRYLASRANPQSEKSYVNFLDQLKKIEAEGIEVIWSTIKDRVSTRMFDEFGSLYTNRTDPKFTALVDAGEYIDLGNLPSFQKELSESKGYHQYCSSTIKSYRMLSKMNRADPESHNDEDTDTPNLN